MKFIIDIEKDIEGYAKILALRDPDEAKKCVKQIEFVYGKRVDGLNGLYRYAMWDGTADWVDLLSNAIRIIEFYKEEFKIKYTHDREIEKQHSNIVTDEETTKVGISRQIEAIKGELEGTISDQEYSEMSDKLDQLEAISKQDISAGKKWIMIKGIVEWSLAKGVDVYIKISPIVNNILAGKEN
jgi:hypothetical protein